jgi:hypothetical protein
LALRADTEFAPTHHRAQAHRNAVRSTTTTAPELRDLGKIERASMRQSSALVPSGRVAQALPMRHIEPPKTTRLP